VEEETKTGLSLVWFFCGVFRWLPNKTHGGFWVCAECLNPSFY